MGLGYREAYIEAYFPWAGGGYCRLRQRRDHEALHRNAGPPVEAQPLICPQAGQPAQNGQSAHQISCDLIKLTDTPRFRLANWDDFLKSITGSILTSRQNHCKGFWR